MTRIVVDTREPIGMIRLLEDVGAVVVQRRLWSGDYEVAERAIVERKTVRGLHFAIVKGHLWPQLGRMRRVARFPYLLLEGDDLDVGPITPPAIRGACIAVMDLASRFSGAATPRIPVTRRRWLRSARCQASPQHRQLPS